MHYAPTPDVVYRWRTRTMIASAVAGVELVALVVVGVLFLDKGWFQHARASAATKSTPAAHHAKVQEPPARPRATFHAAVHAAPLLSRAQTSVLVLNGNGQNGAAGAEARTLQAHGYTIKAVGNAKRNDYAASMVMYRPGMQREAARLAHDAGVPIVSALDGLRPSQLHGAKLLVIVGGT